MEEDVQPICLSPWGVSTPLEPSPQQNDEVPLETNNNTNLTIRHRHSD